MGKVLTVSCRHCGYPTKVYSSGEQTGCVWCSKPCDTKCRIVKESSRCEKCNATTGDDLCKKCTTAVVHDGNIKRVANTKEGVDFVKKASLIGPYITWGEFNQDILDFADNLKGKGYDAIIGVPRSGLVVASQMSIRMGVPLYAIGEYGPMCLGGGFRVRERNQSKEPKKALLVEDSTASGRSMREAVEWMEESMVQWNVKKAAVYATPSQLSNLDEYHRELDLPHLFEWNLIWNKVLMDGRKVAVDFDGILCPDFTPDQDDDGYKYIAAMEKAKCLVPSDTHLYAIVTARLSKYRPWTEDWLRRHGITCKHLIMGKWETKEDREKDCIATYKADACKKLKAEMYIESCPIQADVIKNKSNIVVLCPALGGSIAK